MKGRRITVSISIGRDMLDNVDRLARKLGVYRSAIILKGIEYVLDLYKEEQERDSSDTSTRPP